MYILLVFRPQFGDLFCTNFRYSFGKILEFCFHLSIYLDKCLKCNLLAKFVSYYKVVMKSVILGGFLLLSSIFCKAQLNVQIKGGDITTCANHFVDLSVTVVSGTPNSYTWISSVGTFADSTSALTRVVFTASGQLILKTEDGTNTFYDTVNVTANPLQNIVLSDKDLCQNVESIDLKDQIVVSPAVYLGTPSWKCLECNGNNFDSMIVDEGPGAGITDYKLRVGKSFYSLKNADKDSVILEYTYVNQHGCTNKDTVSVRIWKVPELKFSQMSPLCWNDGVVSLNTLTGVNLTDGSWSCYDTSGFSHPSNLGPISGDSINTLNSSELGGIYYLRYLHISSGCPVFRDTVLRIKTLPAIYIDNFSRTPPRYCEDMSDQTLSANPSGGLWTSSNASALVNGNAFSPSGATQKNTNIWFYYHYTSPVTGCSNLDSIFGLVEPLPELTVPQDTNLYRSLGQTSIALTFNIEADYHGGVGYYTTDLFGTKSRYQARGNDSTVTVDITFASDTIERFRVIANAIGLGSCSDITDYFDVIVHPPHPADVPELLIADVADIYPNPTSGIFKIGTANPNLFNITLVDKWGRIRAELKPNGNNELVWNEKGLYILILEDKKSKQQYHLRMLVR
jgi:hypothetical protein